MKRFVEGEDRRQGVLLPEYLDDFVAEENQVRVIEAFVDELDLRGLGFEGVVPEATGRPAYHPATMLKIYVYGYVNQIASSRRLERETQRNIELMWLTGRLMPDFKTIADFRRDSGPAIRAACAQFVVLCRQFNLFTRTIVAIDGSKFKAVNNRDKNFTVAKVAKRIEQVEASIARYLAVLDRADREDGDMAEAKTIRLKEKIAGLQRQMQALREIGKQVEAAPVEFSPINFNDLMVVWGIYAWKPELPATMGNEGAGKVIAIGEGLSSVKVGDRVILPFTLRKWQQRVLVPAEELIVAPPDADPQQAAMMAINPVTAALLLDQYVDLQPGDAVVYNAATSGLAQWLAALAGRRGLRTIGLVRRSEDVERVKLGGCEIVVIDDEEIGAVQARLRGLNVRLALDVIGSSSAGRLLHLLSPQGKLVTYGVVSGKAMELPGSLLIWNGLTVEGFFEGHPHILPKIAPALRELVKMIGPGGIRQPITATYPIDRIKEAVAHAVKGGRILLSLSDG